MNQMRCAYAHARSTKRGTREGGFRTASATSASDAPPPPPRSQVPPRICTQRHNNYNAKLVGFSGVPVGIADAASEVLSRVDISPFAREKY